MDISVSDILAAIDNGETAAGNITNFHPVTGAGLVRWIEVVGRLREGLSEHGPWTESNPSNRPVSKHTKYGYSLSPIGGNEATGIIDHPSGPLAARKKGVATAEAVTAGLAALIEVETLRPNAQQPPGTRPPVGCWFLLYHRADGEARLEVSLPLGFEGGQFTGWQVRVILDSWKPRDVTQNPLDVGGQDVDFQVDEVG